tara:strand:+ start:180 stop:680 length:501 start_codon:yes stop_codon:yes gene_type:complete
MVENYISLISSNELKVFILSMLPITELRFSIPYGYFILEMPIFKTAILSIIGNILIGYFIIIAIGPIMSNIRKIYLFKKVINSIFSITRRKGARIDKLKFFGLLLFVGIPMPFTGVWTGSLAAYLFGLNTFKSILTIIGGVLLSSSIVTFICFSSKELLLYFNIII